MSENENPSSGMDRRTFIKGSLAGLAALVVGKRILGTNNESQKPDFDKIPQIQKFENGYAFDPEVYIRKLPGNNHEVDNEQIDESEIRLSPEDQLKLNAPVFTLIHEVAAGESMSALASRYYAAELVESGIALNALIAANKRAHPDPNFIKPADKLYIPVTEPAVVHIDGKNPLEIAAEKYGFSLRSIKALNAKVADGIVYLPIQAMPQLQENEDIYITKETDKSYYGIAQEGDYNLATLLGRNRPDASNLEHGHILIVRKDTDSPQATNPTLSEQPETTSPTTSTIITEQETAEEDKTVASLMSQRSWNDEIDGSLESAKLEQAITIEQLKKITLTPEGYKKFVKSIVTKFAGAFEEAKTTHHAGIIDNPDFFILHHTAQGYKEGRDGVQQFIQSMINNRLSVQWLIDRKGIPYLLVRNPKQATNHARPYNNNSTGVENMTDSSRAQGSLSKKQLESSLYLAYYVHTEVYGYGTDKLNEVVFGHRDINDRKHAGTAGKPDFFTNVIEEAILPKLKQLANQMR